MLLSGSLCGCFVVLRVFCLEFVEAGHDGVVGRQAIYSWASAAGWLAGAETADSDRLRI